MNKTTEQGLPPLADLEQEIRSLSYAEKVELLEWMRKNLVKDEIRK